MIWLHSNLRWIILILFIITIVRHLIQMSKKNEYDKTDKILDLTLVSSLDLMLLIGIYVFFTSPIGFQAYEIPGFMKEKYIRKIAVEHPILMISAIVVAHIAGAQRKKNIESVKKHKKIAILFIVSLALILLGIPKWN